MMDDLKVENIGEILRNRIKGYEQKVDTSEAWMKKLYPTGFQKLDDEDFVGKLITTALRTQDLKKSLKKSVLFVTKEGELIETSYKGVKILTQDHIDHFKKAYKDEGIVSILNEMPFDKALSIYESHSK